MTDSNQTHLMLTQDVTAMPAGAKQRVKVGEFTVFCPTVFAFSTVIAEAKVTGTDADGVPEFDTDAANWLQRAITALAKAEARNKLQSGSAEVKPGLKVPTTFEELITPAQGTGSNALAAIADFIKGFQGWIIESGKPEAIATSFGQLCRQRAMIALQGEKPRAVLAQWLEAYCMEAQAAGALTDYQATYAVGLIEACQGKEEESLDDLLAGY